jgi:hypothetical protein
MIEHPPEIRPTVAMTIRCHWKRFLPIWLFPLYFLSFPFQYSDRLVGPSASTVLFMTLPFFAAFAPVALLWLAGKVRYSHLVMLGILAPFAIWTAAVLVRRAVLMAMDPL